MTNTLDTFTAATVIGDTDLLHIKTDVGGVAESDKKITGANAKTAFLPTRYVAATTDATASYELVLANAGGIHEMTSGSANGVVIPANASVAFPVNTRIDLIQTGAGLTTVTITSDTLTGDAVSFGQNKLMSLWKKSATVWHITGGTT